jgi:mono/diheme cytochrome c family protein
MSDEALLDAHERLVGAQPDEKARYRLLPIGILFVFSGLILFAGTYLNRYTAHYSGVVYNENSKGESSQVEAKPDPLAVGRAAFNQVCITCHQATGQGLPGTYPPLDGSEWVNGAPERVIRIVLYGLNGTVHVEGKQFNATAMPTFGQGVTNSAYNWSDDRIAAVLSYVRQSWSNKSAPITADEVAAIHKQVGDHKPMTEADLEAVK